LLQLLNLFRRCRAFKGKFAFDVSVFVANDCPTLNEAGL